MKNDLEITILSKDDILKSNYTLKVFASGVKATQFGRILGFSNHSNKQWIKEDDLNIYNAPFYNGDGEFGQWPASSNTPSIRPAVKLSAIRKYINNDLPTNENTFSFEFGEYPQSVVSDKYLGLKLERLFNHDKLTKTGKYYITNAPYIEDNKKQSFVPYHHIEYEYEGNKYIRLEGYKVDNSGSQFLFSELFSVYGNTSEVYWVKVEPIEWLADLENDIAFANRGLMSGIIYFSFYDESYDRKNFNQSDVYMYLNTYFVKELLNQNIIDNNYDYINNMYNETISKKFK